MHQQGLSKLDMRLAINHAHQAVELTLRKKAELLGENPFYFPEILKVLKNKGIRIPYERQIVELNEARKMVQHYGTTPNNTDARRLIFIAKDFLVDFWKEAFGIDYDDISLINLISNDKVRRILREAEKTNNYKQAIVKATLAIYEIKLWIENKFHGKTKTHSLMATWGVENALDFILDIALSGPFAYKLWKLREYTGIIFLPIAKGEPMMQQLKDREFTREDATSVLELAIEYALWAEQVYG